MHILVPTIQKVAVESISGSVAIRKDKLTSARLIDGIGHVKHPDKKIRSLRIAYQVARLTRRIVPGSVQDEKADKRHSRCPKGNRREHYSRGKGWTHPSMTGS